MPGASQQTRRVKALNANWVAGPHGGADGDDGRFEIMIVTDDDQQHMMAISPTSITARIALTRADSVLMWDPTNRTPIAANLVAPGCHPPDPPPRAHLDQPALRRRLHPPKGWEEA